MIAQERAKYERMWARPEYRKWSPGAESVADAVEFFGRTGTLIDFGCGDGKAVDRFVRAGFGVVGVDLVSLRSGVVQACLWESPLPVESAEFGFCADVMEHIPPDYVSAVLNNIAVAISDAAYFRIATIPDGMGRLIGERLHLTVKPAAWWLDELAAVFRHSEMRQETQDHCVITCMV